MSSGGKSRPIDRILNVFVSGAAVPVLLGALFKITHAPGADIWLKVGLYVEAAIFLVYALLYAVSPPPEGPEPAAAPVATPELGNPALKSMEKMLVDADITPANLNKLSAGFQKLGTTVSSIAEVGDIVKTSGDYAQKTKAASVALDAVTDAYKTTANSLSTFNAASESTKHFHDQVQVLTKNLSSLNTIYELELQESNNHLKALNSFYGKLAQTSAAMEGSVDDAKKAQEQIGLLATNLGRLNSVYGNMLSAMQGR
ncbi:MAG: gliding motility protein GldL [Segetibacter sp.]|nr:gliding motility protein GldL [Segetibacter sp.]